MYLSSSLTSKPVCPLPLQHCPGCYRKWVQERYRPVKGASFGAQHLYRIPHTAIFSVAPHNWETSSPCSYVTLQKSRCSSLTPAAPPQHDGCMEGHCSCAFNPCCTCLGWFSSMVSQWFCTGFKRFILNIPAESDKTHLAHFSIKCKAFLEQNAQNSHNYSS